MRKVIQLFFLIYYSAAFSQIKGKITDTNKNPLSFVSIYFNETITGTTSNNDGYYELDANKVGNYTVVFQFLGYKTVKKSVFIDRFPFEINVVLEDENIILDEISISNKENPANKIIRNSIDNKEKNTAPFKKYTSNFYSRGLFRVKNAPKKILGQEVGDLGGGLDSTRTGIIYLSETISEIAYQKKPTNFIEKIIASKVSGSDNGISFNRAKEANFDFYNNTVIVGESNLVSPIADGAFGYYQFTLEGSFYDSKGLLINKVRVTPKRDGDRVFSGFIYIVEDDWAIYGIDLVASGRQVGIPIIDILKFKQNYNYSEKDKAWVKISQTIDFKFGLFGFNVDGRFSAAYSNYHFSPDFTKKPFTNEMLSFADGATEKDSIFWDQLRPVPLTSEEVKDYVKKDRIKVVRKSKRYLDSIDQKNNRFKLMSLITGYSYRNSYKKWSLSLNSPLTNIAYNTVQGWNASTNINYFKRLDNKGKWIRTGVDINYGFSEKKVRPVFYFSKKWNNIDRPKFTFSTGISTNQFNDRNPISRFNNTTYSLLRKKNYLKIYEKNFGKIQYSQEVNNGIYLSGDIEYAERKPLFNTTNFVIFGRDIAFQSNNPLDPRDVTAPFTKHKLFSLNLGIRFAFGQKYLSYPNSKFNIESSKYPNVSINYRKNFGITNREFTSNLLVSTVRQFVPTENFGNFRYATRSGIFFQKKDIPFMDYLHINGNQLIVPPRNRLNSFNLLDYYTFSTNDKYTEAHIEHNFQGYLLNKIPLINQLNFHLVTGAKGLFTGGRKPYFEYSIGLDNIGFGKWRGFKVNFVQSIFNGTKKDGFLFGITIN